MSIDAGLEASLDDPDKQVSYRRPLSRIGKFETENLKAQMLGGIGEKRVVLKSNDDLELSFEFVHRVSIEGCDH